MNDEIEFLAALLVRKVWQGDERRLGLARQCASVVISGIQDYMWELSKERRSSHDDQN